MNIQRIKQIRTYDCDCEDLMTVRFINLLFAY